MAFMWGVSTLQVELSALPVYTPNTTPQSVQRSWLYPLLLTLQIRAVRAGRWFRTHASVDLTKSALGAWTVLKTIMSIKRFHIHEFILIFVSSSSLVASCNKPIIAYSGLRNVIFTSYGPKAKTL